MLIHNGSLSQHQIKLQNQFPEIEHLVLKENLGFSGGANAGLKSAFAGGSDWVLFLTNDCQLIQIGRPPEKASLSAPLIWRRKVGKIDSLGGKLKLNQTELRHCLTASDFESPTDLAYVPGTAFWIHRDIFAFSGGFDESLGTYWEDVDLSLRIPEHLSLSPQTEIIHSVGKTCHGDVHYTTYLFQRNRKRVCLNHSPNSISKLRITAALAKSWTKTFYKLACKRDLEKMKILAQAIRD